VKKLILAAAATLAITLGACTVEVKEPKAKETPTTTTTTQPAPPVAPAPVAPVVDGNAVFCDAWLAIKYTAGNTPEREVAWAAMADAILGITDDTLLDAVERLTNALSAGTDEAITAGLDGVEVACGGEAGWGLPDDNGPEV